jgi:uncharacterized protein YegJ (DUF2314 family)
VTTLTKIFLFTLLFTNIAFVGCSKSAKADKTIGIKEDDAEMNAAIAKARETLPRFWEASDHPGQNTAFCLKVKITEGKEVEHFWMEKVEKKDGKIFGDIGNDPEFVHNVKLGDHIEIPEADISDWLYMHDGKMVGNYTIRVLFKHMSADEVAKYKAILAEP